MSTIERVVAAPPTGSVGSRAGWAVSDALAIARRNLLKYIRIPTLLIFSTVQPIMFVILFRYVFGGAIRLPPGLHYVDFLMPGIFIQVVVFGSTQTGVGLAEDLQGGMIERFRSLPMARSAVLAGRTLSGGATRYDRDPHGRGELRRRVCRSRIHRYRWDNCHALGDRQCQPCATVRSLRA